MFITSTAYRVARWAESFRRLHASLLRRGELTCHCLLVESDEGLVLIDTGFGLRDVVNPRRRLSTFFLVMLKPEFREEMTAIRKVERLGFTADDARHIVLSHLDFDHAGGLDDFPHAKVDKRDDGSPGKALCLDTVSSPHAVRIRRAAGTAHTTCRNRPFARRIP